ncbi:esterase [Butyrivibrio sp. FC2001]|uniref:esterase n=1 Tax=Butyrivibrio sp. FC2001 TaxID=1280671 RepID=UPI0003F4D7DC|nr:esterase [Butyrivibrio sp. FC2001]
MEKFEFGNPESNIVLIQLIDGHDLKTIDNEFEHIQKSSDIRLIAIKVDDWNRDLSPWEAPAVFGDEGFGDGAEKTLAEVLKYTEDKSKTYYLGGYSLAGLFALWAVYQTDVFSGVAAASPSAWFPGFFDYMKEHDIKVPKIYLSLGDKEEKTRNPVMSTVGDRIRAMNDYLTSQGKVCTLEWNQGNHFKEPDLRMAKGFSFMLR